MKKAFKIFSYIVGAILILGFIMAMFGGGDTEPATTEPEATEVNAEPAKEPEAKEEAPKNEAVPFGEVAALDDMGIEVLGISIANHLGSDDFGIEPDGQFLLVDVSITNNKKKAITVDSSFFKIVEPDGTEYISDGEAFVYVDDTIILESINPKNTKTGKVVFDLPESVQEAVLEVDSDILGIKSTKMELK